MRRLTVRAALLAAACSSVTFMAGVGSSLAAPAKPTSPVRDAKHARVVEHWTPARRAAAIPRDLVRDARGQGYLRRRGGTLEPYGRRIDDAAGAAADKITPNAKPGGGDTTLPSISSMNPAAGATIGASYTFQATVTDASGLRSVIYKVQKQGAATQSFTASLSANNVWTAALSGFTDGNWSWSVVAKDKANNTATSPTVSFVVSTGGGGGGGDTVENSPWTQGGAVQTAVGRLYFEMPGNARRTRWVGYVCSGTVVDDGTSGRSVILTASHCVYDDANKAFARNVLFIPDQGGTSGAGTDLNCSNDPFGCWTPYFGVVDVNWTTRTFPDNVAWDYGFYVVNDAGAHSGAGGGGALDQAIAKLPMEFGAPAVNLAGSNADFTHALGYSYSDDPNFMYCAEDMTTEGTVNWWLPSCGLSGGSSGGPWVQNMSGGTGDIVSVNSWGYTNQPGMAGPKLSGTSASCVFSEARSDAPALPAADGDEGLIATCP
jgi:hypothetical protein